VVFGAAVSNDDYASVANPPSTGFLFSVWTKMRVADQLLRVSNPTEWWATSYPYDIWHHINMYTGSLRSDAWHLRFLTANSDWSYTSSDQTAKQARYNANTEFMVDNTNFSIDPEGYWLSDFSYFESNFASFTSTDGQSIAALTEAQITDWVWVAWQVVPNSDGSGVTARQWVKFGTSGPVFLATNSGTSSITWTALKTLALSSTFKVPSSAVSSWLPSTAFNSLRVGREGSPSYLTKARVDALSTTPTVAQLEAIANGTNPASSAWAYWPLSWTNGAANFADTSGNGRNLIPKSASFTEGAAGPY
jgi:hypothetical protein